MFTGIVEITGDVIRIERTGDILNVTVRSGISSELKVDQSVAHNGVCLTVIAVMDDMHTVQLVQETLERSHFNTIMSGAVINLERSMPATGRFEGHLVQGHVDCMGQLIAVKDGIYFFRYPIVHAKLLVEKGSVCVNGVSLTIASLEGDIFGVAIIPYTLANTNFHNMTPGALVNLEFDILAKHIARMMELRGIM